MALVDTTNLYKSPKIMGTCMEVFDMKCVKGRDIDPSGRSPVCICSLSIVRHKFLQRSVNHLSQLIITIGCLDTVCSYLSHCLPLFACCYPRCTRSVFNSDPVSLMSGDMMLGATYGTEDVHS